MGACASLLCDNCRQPGRCCSGFGFKGWPTGDTMLEALVFSATVVHGMSADGHPWGRLGGNTAGIPDENEHVTVGLPFMPLWRKPGAGWVFWCPLLVAGRCSDYENRPALCRDFRSGSDTLCAMHVPRPPGSDTMKKLDHQEHIDG